MNVIVVGGGVIGMSVAWHLLEAGISSVRVLERAHLGCGTTWHSAGHITWMPSPETDEPIHYMIGLLEKLERESGQHTGWKRTGRIFLAVSDHALGRWAQQKERASEAGVAGTMMSPREVANYFPFVNASMVRGGWLNPLSGRVNPSDLVASFARSIRLRGGEITENCEVNRLLLGEAGICGVGTSMGRLSADVVIVCTGIWTRELVAHLGQPVLAHGACEHFYAIVDVAPSLPRGLPDFSCPERLVYGREEVGSLMVGFFERNAKPLQLEEFPSDFAFRLLPEDWDHIGPHYEAAMELFPILSDAPVRRLVNGPESFTPDGQPLVGPLGNINGLYVACGMNSSGVESSGMVGAIVADYVTESAARFPAVKTLPSRFGTSMCSADAIDRMMVDAPSRFYSEYFA